MSALPLKVKIKYFKKGFNWMVMIPYMLIPII